MELQRLMNIAILSMFVYDLLQAVVYTVIGDFPSTLKYCIFTLGFAVLIETKKKLGKWL